MDFNTTAFMDYLEKTFEGFDNHFLRETVGNIIWYGLNYRNDSKDQLICFLKDLLPDDLDYWEINVFADDNILTDGWRKEKKQHICSHCGKVIGRYEIPCTVNAGTPHEFTVCDLCHDSLWDRCEITDCAFCGNYFTPDVLHEEENSFTECPFCHHDIVEGYTREEFEED